MGTLVTVAFPIFDRRHGALVAWGDKQCIKPGVNLACTMVPYFFYANRVPTPGIIGSYFCFYIYMAIIYTLAWPPCVSIDIIIDLENEYSISMILCGSRNGTY